MFDGITFYRLSRWLYLHRIPVFPKIVQFIIFFLFNSYIPYQAMIGKGTRLGHRGIGVVINREAIVGKNVLIRAHVTIGKKESSGGAPTIGDNVQIGDGAKILGDITIGNFASVGANAVVMQDVPEGSVAVGVPARILNKGKVS